MPSSSLSQRLFTKLQAACLGSQTTWRVAFLCLLALVLLFTSLKYASKITKPGDGGEQSRSAFLRWRTMIRDVFTGTNIYVGKNEYPNPPVMAIILRPFAELPPLVGAMTWFYAKVLLAGLSALWVFRLVAPTVPDGAKAAAILLTLPAIMGDLTHNNVNIFILFLLAGCLELYRRGNDVASGLVLGLAIACKLTPLMFLAYFVWKRAGSVVGGCVVGILLSLIVFPGAVFGWERNGELLNDWYKLMVERPVFKGEITSEHPNQSIVGLVYRLSTNSPSFIEYVRTPVGDVPTPAAYHNLFDIGRPAAWVVVKVFTLAYALAIVLLCRTPRNQRGGWRFAAECGLIVLGMLLLSERTWKHHAVILLFPAAALTFAVTLELPNWVRRFLIVTMILSATLMTLPGVCGPHNADLALVYGTHTLAFGLLVLGTGVVLVYGLQHSDRLRQGSSGEISG